MFTQVAFVVDGVATSIGALMGTSPVTTYIESAPGIEEVGSGCQLPEL
jgi:AGZA family xanthine/uracil permease-like MFS transporter